jgi:hypothetical protein
MQYRNIFLALLCFSSSLYAETDKELQREILRLQHQTQDLQKQLNKLQKRMVSHETNNVIQVTQAQKSQSTHPEHHQIKFKDKFHSTHLTVHSPEAHPESIGYYPTALVADNRVVTYIAGTPVVSSPYLGDRPAFDGSDYIVNISSINRDIRLMQQRRRLYRAYERIGYPIPQMPIIALSGKAEPVGVITNPFRNYYSADLTLGSSELDVAATLNQNVEAFMSLAYDASPPDVGPRINNSAFSLNQGFVNIGNLDKTPFYFTAGQLFVPFGRYSSAMVSSPLTLQMARTKTRPFILGYKSQDETGPFAAAYAYRSDTNLGSAGVGGINFGYIFQLSDVTGEIGAGYISSINDAAGMQNTATIPGTIFGGFGSFTNGNEAVQKTPAADVHANIGIDRFNFAAEWVGAVSTFRPQDLSFNGRGATPSAGQVEVDMTFRSFNRPSSIGVGYQWTRQALALNLPQQRISAVYNISIWKDTVESLEYRHDIDYNVYQFANGAAPQGVVNAPTLGTGRASDTVAAQIGVYF